MALHRPATSRRLAATCIACALVMTVGTASAQPARAAAQAPEQCLRFDQAYFHWLRKLSDTATAYDSSRVIVLTNDEQPSEQRLPRWPPSARSVRVPGMTIETHDAQHWLQWSYWRSLPPDYLEVAWINGFYGPVFQLRQRGDSLVGSVTFTTDVRGPALRTEAARAVRIACPT